MNVAVIYQIKPYFSLIIQSNSLYDYRYSSKETKHRHHDGVTKLIFAYPPRNFNSETKLLHQRVSTSYMCSNKIKPTCFKYLDSIYVNRVDTSQSVEIKYLIISSMTLQFFCFVWLRIYHS